MGLQKPQLLHQMVLMTLHWKNSIDLSMKHVLHCPFIFIYFWKTPYNEKGLVSQQLTPTHRSVVIQTIHCSESILKYVAYFHSRKYLFTFNIWSLHYTISCFAFMFDNEFFTAMEYNLWQCGSTHSSKKL